MYKISQDPNETQRTLVYEAYPNLMRQKFRSYEIMHEHSATGKIHNINNNFAFLLTSSKRLIFVHRNNVLLSSINQKFKFYDALKGKDIVHDPVANKPAAINLKLNSGALIDSLMNVSRFGNKKPDTFLPYSSPLKNRNDCNDAHQNNSNRRGSAIINGTNCSHNGHTTNTIPIVQECGQQHLCQSSLSPTQDSVSTLSRYHQI